jgi:putative transposase
VGRKRVRRLMRQLGIEAIYPKPKLSQRNHEHKVYPYLLRGLAITRVNQVWCTDITYLPVLRGHYYLVAIMDCYIMSGSNRIKAIMTYFTNQKLAGRKLKR